MDISDFIGAAKTFHVLGIKVTKDGDLINEWYSEPECRRNIYSATKSFTSCAVGFAVQEGLLSLDEKLTDAFPEDLPDVIDDNLKMATVRDLLTMCLGQEQGSLMGEQRPLYQEDDWVKMSLAIPFQYKPGTHFVYNNVGPYLAGILVQRRSGCDLVSYLTPRLFKHLGIKRPTWETDPLGNSFGAGGLFLTLSELHKFGLFYLNKGKWNGKQIYPKMDRRKYSSIRYRQLWLSFLERKIQFLPGGWKIFSDFHDPSGQECGYFDGRRMPERGRTYECFV